MHLILSGFPHAPINRAFLPSSDSRKILAQMLLSSVFFTITIWSPNQPVPFHFYLFLMPLGLVNNPRPLEVCWQDCLRFRFCSLMGWISVWRPCVQVQAHIGEPRSNCKLLSLFGLQTTQNLLTLGRRTDWKQKRERRLSWSVAASLWNAQTEQMITFCS